MGAAEKTFDTHPRLWLRQQKNEAKGDAVEISGSKFYSQRWEGTWLRGFYVCVKGRVYTGAALLKTERSLRLQNMSTFTEQPKAL